MAATGHTLTEWSSAPGTADGPVAVGSDPDVGQSRDAVVLCESDQAPREFATGFIIGSADGHLITCLHFFGGRASCLVHVGGLQFVADLKFDNANLDMAVARIRGGGYLPGGALKRPSAASARLRSGEMLHCFGRRPQGYLAERVAHVANPSVMLRLHHIGVPVAELDSTMQPGFSGAPALSGADEFRGVVVARVSELAGVRESDVAVLLPADHLTHWIKSLEKEHGYVIWTG
jgi:hypothetical protein